MPDFSPGAVVAGQALARDRYEDASTQYTLEQLTQAQLKRRQAEEDRQRQIEYLARQVDQSTQLSPPPPGAAPPMPGAPSQPMMMPPGPQPGPANVQTAGAPPMSAPQGMPLGAPQGPPMQPNAQQNAMAPAALAMAHMLAKQGPMQVNVSPQGGISGGQLPQGALAQPPAPLPWQARPGGPFAGGGGAPPAAAAGGGIAPPPMGGAGGQGGDDMGLQPAKVINPMEEAGKLVKQGMTPEEAGKTALAMLPIWERMNKSAITNFTEQARIAREVIEFRNAKLREDKERRLAEPANQPKPETPTGFMKEAEALYGKDTPEYRAALEKHTARMDAPSTTTINQSGASAIPAEDQGKTGAEFLKTLPPGIAKEVQAIAEGRQNISAMGYRGAQRQQMLERVNQYDPSFDQTQFAARSATRRDFAAGQAARNITSINTAIGHLGTMDELATAMKNGDVRKLNALVNRVATETGDPDINNFQLAATAVSDEMMRTFRQVGASDAEAARWEKAFKSDLASGQLKGSMQVAVKLLESRAQALGDQWHGTMGDTVQPPEIIHQRSRDVLKQLGVKMTTAEHGRGEAGAPNTNAKGWTLHVDKNGNQAYVSPDGKQFEEVK